MAADDHDDPAIDVLLARRVVDGDRAAEAELCRRMLPRIRAWGMKHTRDEAAANDVAQHAMVSVLEALRAARVVEIDRLGAFVIGTCKNTLMACGRAARLSTAPTNTCKPSCAV